MHTEDNKIQENLDSSFVSSADQAKTESKPNLDFIKIILDAAKITNYAAIQNKVPILRQIRIENTSDIDVKDFELAISSNPSFIEGQRFKFDQLLSGEIRILDQVQLNVGPNVEYLFALNEAEHGHLSIKISAPGFAETLNVTPIEILAKNEWGAVRGLPELVAAHIQPNTVEIDQLLAQASRLLKSSEASLSLDGYQSKNRELVWKQVNAIYKVLCGLEIQYSPPPASFEINGQKIRSTSQFIEGRVATCLDTTILMAACIEQAGLNAVVLFKDGHAWVGVWLVETSFSLSVTDCVQSVRKRVAAGELLMLESTHLTHKLSPSMRHSKDIADEYLEENTTTFQYAIDLRRARELHIRPMKSNLISSGTQISLNAASDNQNDLEAMPSLPPIDPGSLEPTQVEVAQTPQGRLNNWKSKLLDLTLRNKLLNFKPTKKYLKIVIHSPADLEDKLAGEGEFRLSSKPLLMQDGDPRSDALFRQEYGISPSEQHAQKVLQLNELVFDSPAHDFNNVITDIFREGKNTINETGCNSLYIAVGMLHWKETPEAEAVLKAPILLVPVTLTRLSVGAGVRLKKLDEETLFNPTLFQKLLNTFEIVMPYTDGYLPTDGSGVDVEKIFQTLRTKVQELAGFEVKNDCYLGNFSFTKYVMWRDLESNSDKLQKSKVVSHLINHQGESFHDETEAVRPENLDENFSPQSLFTPMLCDSSQLAVICTADRGKNMVVEGPPGTGKTQTITNLISHSLAQGKTVLFVAEKMVALEQVHKRLKEIGLEEFCLELHSSKTKKSDIAKQFADTLDIGKDSLINDWDREAEKIASLRNELNTLVNTLHKTHGNGLTVYHAIGLGIKFKGSEAAKFTWTDADTHDFKQLVKMGDFVGELAAMATRLSKVSGHALSNIGQTNWTPSWENNLLEAANKCLISADALEKAIIDFASISALDVNLISLDELSALDNLSDCLMLACSVPIESIDQTFNISARKKLSNLIEHGKNRTNVWSNFSDGYEDSLKTLDASSLDKQLVITNHTWWPKKWFSERAISNQIRLFSKNKIRIKSENLNSFIDQLAILNDEDLFLKDNASFGKEILGDIFKADKTDWELAASYLSWMEKLSASFLNTYKSKQESLDQLKLQLKEKLCEQNESFEQGGRLFGFAAQLKTKYTEFKTVFSELEILAAPTGGLLVEKNQAAMFTILRSQIANWKTNKNQLQQWCVWNKGRQEAITLGLQELIVQVESGYLNLVDLRAHFEFSYADWWLKKMMDKEPILSGFSGASHAHKIAEFQKVDKKFQELTKHYVRAVLKGRVPTGREITGELASEVGTIRHETQKKRQHKSIRDLIKSVGTVLPKLKPCMLMSPQSVAQYLEAGVQLFDIVIFDEASQIPTWDAVGAIARGKQLVCVGDPKQLPPTSFFNASDSEDILDDDNVQEMESILDECLAVGLPLSRLNWHYRSQNEGLITFSNFQYYDNSLVTFPSPVEVDKSVEFIHSNGIYEPGKSRTNKREAELIVEHIANHYLSGLAKKFSLGVITFNSTQQALIEKRLDEKRLGNRMLDLAISESEQEEIFIKNLENVQGDERDYIFFSITFGKDANGKISMNFGPMNKEGGHRRLNVAATRARHKVKIFSSLRPEDIDLSRTKSRGVADLKTYLDFAINGAKVLASQSSPTGREPDSPFEVAVIKELRDRGWQVVPQIGVSGYRIDLAVINKFKPGNFLLGIECDGATYHSAPSARDRDRLRQLVLEGLGWKIHRIWSTDWWFNPEIPLKNLIGRLSELEAEAESLQ